MSAITIPPRSGTAFTLSKGSFLTVIDPEGEQVSDHLAVLSHAQELKAKGIFHGGNEGGGESGGREGWIGC